MTPSTATPRRPLDGAPPVTLPVTLPDTAAELTCLARWLDEAAVAVTEDSPRALLCESPARALARVLSAAAAPSDGSAAEIEPTGEATTVAEVMGHWLSSAHALLHQWQDAPDRWRLFDAEDVLRAPAMAVSNLRGVPDGVPDDDPDGTTDETAAPLAGEPPAVAAIDPLALIAASAAASASPDASALWTELQASCQVIPETPRAPVESPVQVWRQTRRAEQARREQLKLLEASLAQALDQIRTLEAERRALHDEIETDVLMHRQALEENAGLVAQLQRATTQLSTLGQQLSAAEQEQLASAARLAALDSGERAMGEELRRAYLGWETETARANAAETQLASEATAARQLLLDRDREREALEATIVAAEQQQERLRQELASLRLELQRQREAAGQELRGLRQDLNNSTRQFALVQSQWQDQADSRSREALGLGEQVRLWEERARQAEAQCGLLEAQLADQARSAIRQNLASARWALTEADTLAWMSERHEAPYRELSGRVQLDPRWPATSHHFELRLVEHHGHPGLVLLPGDDGHPPLNAWHPDGDESGRPFQRLMPIDAASAARLDQLPPMDWRLVNGLRVRLATELASQRMSLHPRWATVLGRLDAQWRGLPQRLRYSTACGGWRGTGEGRVLDIVLRDVIYGDSPMRDIALEWRAGASGSPLAWRLADDGLPALGCWPTDPNGTPLADLPLPLGPAVELRRKRQWWQLTDALDRDLLLALLDALPGAAEALDDDSGHGNATQALRNHRDDANRLIEGLNLRQRLRTLPRGLLRRARLVVRD